ncbi:MAG: Xaa-Pro peptidase family protein, partial [Hyphomicrobium sp.]|nr:Xaa-Pro peptidase family protein [Hyphomicrobium sp.]
MAGLTRRSFVGATGALAATSLTGLANAAQGEAAELKPMALPPPIGRPERVQRIARAQALMQRSNVAAVLVESGPSLDYFTGIQWWRSERLTGVVIPATGEPVIVTPFFERPSIAEQLRIPAEIRTWNEDEDPLKLVADFLAERRMTAGRIGMEETNRFFLVDRLRRQMPRAAMVSANPVVREVRMRKTAAELALMQAASDITIAAFRHAWPRVREGMTKDDIDAIIGAATRALGGEYDGGLVLVGEATAYPHGTRQVQRVVRGSNVLFDCGCDVHGYQSDISRSFVWGADPT